MHRPTEEFRDPFSSTADEFDLDDADILDLGPSSPPPVASAAPPEPVEHTPDLPNRKAPQVVTLSPELLDIIVQKVVEKLSEKY